jgi:Cu/Ag efflux protein CusF
MRHIRLVAVLGLALLAAGLGAQGRGIRKGKIKKVDAARDAITITADGKDYVCTVTEQTKIWDASHQVIKEGLKNKAFRPGAAVFFKITRRDGRAVLVGIKLAGKDSRPRPGFQPRRATVKKVDAEKKLLTLTVGGKDLTFRVTDQTKFMGPAGDLKDGLKDERFKAGAAVMFLARQQDGKAVLLGVRIIPTLKKVDTSKLKPLTELGKARYQGYPGGLYPDGKNERPAAHEKAGLALAKKVRPLDAAGKPSAAGKIVLLSVGMSNTTQEFSAFQRRAKGDETKNPRLVIVDGAQGSMTAFAIQQADNGRGKVFWETVDRRLKAAGVTRAQVQVAWVKEADAMPTQEFPKHALVLQAELRKIVRLMKDRFPNLRLVYLSSRICAAFARTPLNPEPFAYETGFAVKWLIEEQLQGKLKAPWLSWGPYLWTNGVHKRADGLTYVEEDFSSDGTHPSGSGQRKVARQLLQFFKTDTTAKGWFLKK